MKPWPGIWSCWVGRPNTVRLRTAALHFPVLPFGTNLRVGDGPTGRADDASLNAVSEGYGGIPLYGPEPASGAAIHLRPVSNLALALNRSKASLTAWNLSSCWQADSKTPARIRAATFSGINSPLRRSVSRRKSPPPLQDFQAKRPTGASSKKFASCCLSEALLLSARDSEKDAGKARENLGGKDRGALHHRPSRWAMCSNVSAQISERRSPQTTHPTNDAPHIGSGLPGLRDRVCYTR